MSLIDDLKNKETGLDEREQYFLDILFDECGGDFKEAMKKSGYPNNVSVGEVRRKLSKEIKKASKDYLVSQTPNAAVKLVSVLHDPSAMGAKNIISAAKEILDRGDVNKEETKVELPDNAIVILPPKRFEEENE
jgi:hypothetical protein